MRVDVPKICGEDLFLELIRWQLIPVGQMRCVVVCVSRVCVCGSVQGMLVAPINVVGYDVRHHFMCHVCVEHAISAGNDDVGDRFKVHQAMRANHGEVYLLRAVGTIVLEGIKHFVSTGSLT